MSVVATGFPLQWVHTFTHTLLSADLLAIFHCMQGKIYLRYRLLVLDSATGDLEIIYVCVGVHPVELGQDQRVRIIEWARRGQR